MKPATPRLRRSWRPCLALDPAMSAPGGPPGRGPNGLQTVDLP
ncbi:hypothetical protein [Acidovorax sp.]|nr:hypothetical protein [Acidovorax sp.]